MEGPGLTPSRNRYRRLRDVRLPFQRPAWHAEAACRGSDPALFYPSRGDATALPKAICRLCPVKQECLDWAIENHEMHGVWGGKSERERRALRRVAKERKTA